LPAYINKVEKAEFHQMCVRCASKPKSSNPEKDQTKVITCGLLGQQSYLGP
jgi:hypothetical protein